MGTPDRYHQLPSNPQGSLIHLRGIPVDIRAIISYQHRLSKEGKPIHVTPG